jgi:hypothetical protein
MLLTFIIIVAIVMMSESLSDAILVISLLSQFLIISTLLSGVDERHNKNTAATSIPWVPAKPAFTPNREGFASRPVIAPGTGIAPGGGRGPAAYPGGLDQLPIYDFGATGPAGTGAVYAPVSSGADGPPLAPGDPFQLNRIESRAGAEPCDYGYAGEARNTFDADRQMVEHGRWRNDPHRVVAGVMRRKELVDKYVREELEEEENSPWWGRWDL